MEVTAPQVRPARRGQPLRSILTSFMRLILPAGLLVVVYVLSFYLLETSVGFSTGAEQALADPAWWMSWGHLTLALAFFLVALTNRARGPFLALGQVVFAWAVIAGLLVFAGSLYGFSEVRSELMPTQVMWAFTIGLLLGHTVAIFAFDWQRGVPWWKAPLIAALLGPLVFTLIFYPFGYFGADVPWGTWLWMHFVALAGTGLVLLLPYAMLRKTIKPAPGLGGA